jgi:hypothetical protein
MSWEKIWIQILTQSHFILDEHHLAGGNFMQPDGKEKSYQLTFLAVCGHSPWLDNCPAAVEDTGSIDYETSAEALRVVLK